MMGDHSCDYVMLYGRRDFADVMKVFNQLTLGQSKERLSSIGLTLKEVKEIQSERDSLVGLKEQTVTLWRTPHNREQ